jgi:hypothetical protein
MGENLTSAKREKEKRPDLRLCEFPASFRFVPGPRTQVKEEPQKTMKNF